MRTFIFLWLGISLLSITACTKDEEKIASMEQKLIKIWHLESMEENGEDIEVKPYEKEATWDFKANHKFVYSSTQLVIVNLEDTTIFEELTTFDWKISADRRWIRLTHGRVETTSIHGGQTSSETKILGTNGDYNMEILVLKPEKLKVNVRYKEGLYTYTFKPG